MKKMNKFKANTYSFYSYSLSSCNSRFALFTDLHNAGRLLYSCVACFVVRGIGRHNRKITIKSKTYSRSGNCRLITRRRCTRLWKFIASFLPFSLFFFYLVRRWSHYDSCLMAALWHLEQRTSHILNWFFQKVYLSYINTFSTLFYFSLN